MRNRSAVLAAAFAAAALAGFVAFRFETIARFAFDRFVPYPVTFASARPTGPFSFVAENAALELPHARIEAASASNRFTAGLFPLRVGFESRLSEVTIRGSAAWARVPIRFRRGDVRVSRLIGASAIDLSGWKSEAVDLDGKALLAPDGMPREFLVTGRIEPGFLTSFFPDRKPPPADAPRVPFEVRYEAGKIEIKANDRIWFRSTWTMRR